MNLRAVIVAVFLEGPRVKEIRPRQPRVDRQRFLEHYSRPGGIALLHQNAADVSPAIGILRISLCDFFERRSGSFQIALQKKANPVVVPTRPLLFRGNGFRLWLGGISRENSQRLRVFGHHNDGQIRNCLEIAGNMRSVASKGPRTVVIIRLGIADVAKRDVRTRERFDDARKGELGIEPTELPIVELRMESDLVTRIFRNVQAIVRRIRRARWNESDVDNGPRRPSVSFIDGIAVPINLKRAIEVRAGLNGTLAIVLYLAAPENRLALFIGGLQFQPGVESVYRPAG